LQKSPRDVNRRNDCGAGLSRAAHHEGKDENRGEQGRNHPYTSCLEMLIAREGVRSEILIAA
jgi:hypothetical protein